MAQDVVRTRPIIDVADLKSLAHLEPIPDRPEEPLDGHVKNVCRLPDSGRNKRETCRYIGCSPLGNFVCLKQDRDWVTWIDAHADRMKPKGDNCPGPPYYGLAGGGLTEEAP